MPNTSPVIYIFLTLLKSEVMCLIKHFKLLIFKPLISIIIIIIPNIHGINKVNIPKQVTILPV